MFANKLWLLLPFLSSTLAANNRVLFCTNSESGAANVILATSHALLQSHPDVEVHIASFPALQKTVKTISDSARKSSSALPITFHTLPGADYSEAITNSLGDGARQAIITAPDISGYNVFTHTVQYMVLPWNGSEYVHLFNTFRDLITAIDPAVVVTETLIAPAVDAVKVLKRPYAIISPNTLKDNFVQDQPMGQMFWKYPAMMSPCGYPLPWSCVPGNLYRWGRLIYKLATSSRIREVRSAMKSNGVENPPDFFKLYDGQAPWLSVSMLETEFPLERIPENVTVCGPIYLSTATVDERDPELGSWLKKAPTVLINLGSHYDFDEKNAQAMVAALKALLDQRNVQVLWKLKRYGNYSDEVFAPIQKYIDSDRVRTTNWLVVDPAALLETGKITLLVHHGGSNCYHEAIATGVPHVILAPWADTYDFANRAEYLGVGIWGNRAAAPRLISEELTRAFLRATGDGEGARRMRKRAGEIKAIVAKKGAGRVIAAKRIVDYMKEIERSKAGGHKERTGEKSEHTEL